MVILAIYYNAGPDFRSILRQYCQTYIFYILSFPHFSSASFRMKKVWPVVLVGLVLLGVFALHIQNERKAKEEHSLRELKQHLWSISNSALSVLSLNLGRRQSLISFSLMLECCLQNIVHIIQLLKAAQVPQTFSIMECMDSIRNWKVNMGENLRMGSLTISLQSILGPKNGPFVRQEYKKRSFLRGMFHGSGLSLSAQHMPCRNWWNRNGILENSHVLGMPSIRFQDQLQLLSFIKLIFG